MTNKNATHLSQLSNQGSDRATAYNMSSKLIRRDDQLFVGWLSAPVEVAPTDTIDTASQARLQAQIQLGVYRPDTQQLERVITLGQGIDNHCGPALALDGAGRLHAVTGAHHGNFLYRWSDRPAKAESWRKPVALGPRSTYPSLAVDSAGTLHLAYREQGDRWQLRYRRKKAGQGWEAPVVLALSPTPGYNHFMQSLTIGPADEVHLTFQYHYAESGRAIDCEGRAIVYLHSEDGGESWYNEDQRATLPLTVDTMRPIIHHPEGGIRVGNHLVDANNQPWLFASLPGQAQGGLLHRTHSGWNIIDGQNFLSQLNLNVEGGRATSLSQDAQGRLHLLMACHPGGQKTPWFDPSLEIFHLQYAPQTQVHSLNQLTPTDPGVAHWLPALEQWDWTRPAQCCVDGLYFTYTRGLNAGGIGGDNQNALATQVLIGHLRSRKNH